MTYRRGRVPTTSNLNLAPNVIKANLVFVPVGADGKVRIFNFQGSTDVVADVVGYMQSGQNPATRAGRVVPLTSPYRTLRHPRAAVRGEKPHSGQGRPRTGASPSSPARCSSDPSRSALSSA